jgi:hypothetical protein
MSKPHVLIGETRSYENVSFLREWGWGRIFLKGKPCPFPFERWAFDNGAFVAWRKGFSFPEDEFLHRMEEAEGVNSEPYLAVTPDIVAGGLTSLDFSLSWRERLKNGWPWYLAVQDGMATNEVCDIAHLFSGIFLGGTDKFKFGAEKWCDLAHACGKKFHYGRAGTLRKLAHAIRVGADSIDSSFPLWTKERFGEFRQFYLADHEVQHELAFRA